MKKVLFLFCLLVSSFTFGQNSNTSIELGDVIFYGVDFSSAKVYGAAETPEQFKKMYKDMNLLFLSEAKKYDVAKHFNINVAKVSGKTCAQRKRFKFKLAYKGRKWLRDKPKPLGKQKIFYKRNLLCKAY